MDDGQTADGVRMLGVRGRRGSATWLRALGHLRHEQTRAPRGRQCCWGRRGRWERQGRWGYQDDCDVAGAAGDTVKELDRRGCRGCRKLPAMSQKDRERCHPRPWTARAARMLGAMRLRVIVMGRWGRYAVEGARTRNRLWRWRRCRIRTTEGARVAKDTIGEPRVRVERQGRVSCWLIWNGSGGITISPGPKAIPPPTPSHSYPPPLPLCSEQDWTFEINLMLFI